MYLFQFQVIFSEVSKSKILLIDAKNCLLSIELPYMLIVFVTYCKLLNSAASQLQVDRLCFVSQTQSIVFASPVNLSGVVCAALLCSWLFSLNVSKSACVFSIYLCF